MGCSERRESRTEAAAAGGSMAARRRRRDAAAALLLLLCANKLCAVKIIKMDVPEIIQFGVQNSVILDCDYVYGNYTSGLVIKWFFKNKTRPVYQWIPSEKPQAMGILRGKVDLGYRASEDALTMHRALRIVSPGTEVSGDYTCVVSTFMDEDQRTKRMTVFVPERNFRLVQNKSDDDSVNVICFADGAFPAPSLTLATPDRHLEGVAHDVRSVGGRYAASASVTLRDAELPAPAQFICTLRIPQANYVVRKEAIYYPGGSDAVNSTSHNVLDFPTINTDQNLWTRPISTTPELPTAADMQLAAAVGSRGSSFYLSFTSLLWPVVTHLLVF